MLTLKRLKLVILLVIIGVIGLTVFFNYRDSSNSEKQSNSSEKAETPASPNDRPKVVSITPTPGENNVLLPTQPIEITFNIPVQNGGEFKHKLDPKLEYDISTSNDRKTIIIKPKSTYPLGQGITLIISPETKFDNQQKLENEVIYHFQTIQYKGV